MRLCFTGSMPLHTTNHISMLVLWSYDETMFYRKHTLTYHYLISMTVLWSYDEAMFYMKHALTYHRPHLYGSLMIPWWDYALQEACPYIPPTSSLWQSYNPIDEAMLYRKHALTYHQPHLYGSLMILWWDYVLQEACPYIPQATSLWQPYDPMMRLCFTGSMPLHTTNHVFMTALWSYWWGYALQEAFPYIPPTTSLWQSNDSMMRLCFTGSMPLHTTGHISMAALWSYDETMFYRKHALTYHRPHLYGSLMILWWGYVLQEACPYIPPTTSLWQPYDPMMRLCFTGSMPLHTTNLISMTVL